MGAENNRPDVPRDLNWRARENAKFANGTYKPVPWAFENWAQRQELWDHFAHVSKEDPTQIAFTASADHGELDRQTRMKPGRYLQRYCAKAIAAWHGIPETGGDIDRVIRSWVERWSEANEPVKVLFATTPDEIEKVYVGGPSSCMSHPKSSYDSDIHPTRVYGAGDLAIAYIMRDGKVTARCVCWPAKKTRGTIYGDHSRLNPALVELGYTAVNHFKGAKLLKIEEDGSYVLPYIDGHAGVAVRKDHLIIAEEYDLWAHATEGRVPARPQAECDNCGDRYNPDDGYYIEGRDQTWCEHCYENYATCCDHCNNSQHHADTQTAINRRGREITVCDNCLEHSDDFTYCDHCDTYHASENVGEDINGDAVCNNCAANWERCVDDGRAIPPAQECECGACREERREEEEEETETEEETEREAA